MPKIWSLVFLAPDEATLTLFDRNHSLLSDVKEFSTIIIFHDMIALPVLLSKAADAITILDLDQ